jgi:hypothetical protein
MVILKSELENLEILENEISLEKKKFQLYNFK